MQSYVFARGCDWVERNTLHRIKLLEPPVGTFKALCYIPPDSQVNAHCDACSFRHRSSNIDCSATIGRTKGFTTTGFRFYDINTHKPIRGTFVVLDIVRRRRSRLAKITYKRL